MALARTWPRVGGLPELHTYQCQPCNVVFTEGGVKRNGITGLAFGNPLTLAIASGADWVNTDFAGRSEISQLGDFLPFNMTPKVPGFTDIF